MSDQAATWNETQYANRAMHIYQTKGYRLKGMVTAATRIVGAEKAVFWLAGKSKAYEKKRGDRNIRSGGERKKFEAYLRTWKVFDDVDEWDMDRMSVDEMEVVYESGGMALGRATDIAIYKDMAAAATTVPSGADFSSAAFNAANALMLCKMLQDQKIPWDGQVYCGLPSLQWNQLLANKVVNSADHVSREDLPFTKATDSRFWNGVNWFLNVEEDAEDFYPVPESNKQDAFIWHKSAEGWANHTDMRVRRTWDTDFDRWVINMECKGTPTPLQEGNGILRFRTSSNSAIAIV
jgi:hypothetical protein